MHTLRPLNHRSLLLVVSLLASLVPPLFAPPPAQAAPEATTFYVDAATGSDTAPVGAPGDPPPPICTKERPCRSIQKAIDSAASGDTILVAGSAVGTVYRYADQGSSCISSAGTTSVVCVYEKQLTISGGYSPQDGWTRFDPIANLTVVDGEQTHRGIFVMSLFKPAQVSLSMTGFTVRQGFGSGIKSRPAEDNYFGFGGGLFAEYVGALILQQMQFETNVARGEDRGSGVGGSAAGGAISLRNVSSATFDHVFFRHNQAIAGSGVARGGYSVGGALFTYKSQLTGTYLVFENNQSVAGRASGSGAARDSSRADAFGGAASFQEESVITLRFVAARNNLALGGHAPQEGGGAFGGAFKAEVATVSISDSEINFNQARGGDAFNSWIGSGGGLEAINSTITLERVQLIGNQAIGGNGAGGHRGVGIGGGVNVNWSAGANHVARLTMANCIVAGNALVAGTGDDWGAGGGGGALYGNNATIDIAHSTFAGNSGGALAWGTAFLFTESNNESGHPETVVTIRNSIVSDHHDTIGDSTREQPLMVIGGTGAEVRFAGGLKWNNRGKILGYVEGWSSLLEGDPGYIGPGPGEFDYHIGAASLARDRGTAPMSRDIDRQPRDTVPDFGADEYVADNTLTVIHGQATADSVFLSWKPGLELAGQVNRYWLSDSSRTGLDQVTSDRLIDVGLATSYRLENLPLYSFHTLQILAKRNDGSIAASLNAGTYMTTDKWLNIPYVAR